MPGSKLTAESWRFIAPIFLHVGIVHFLLNMFAQWVICGVVERMIGKLSRAARRLSAGSVPFLIVYITGGYYGFVLGGNFARVGIPTVGASGAILATVCRCCRAELMRGRKGAWRST